MRHRLWAGRVVVDFGPGRAELAALPDGRVVVDAMLDPFFAGDGSVALPFGPNPDPWLAVEQLAVSPDGRVVAAATLTTAGGTETDTHVVTRVIELPPPPLPAPPPAVPGYAVGGPGGQVQVVRPNGTTSAAAGLGGSVRTDTADGVAVARPGPVACPPRRGRVESGRPGPRPCHGGGLR